LTMSSTTFLASPNTIMVFDHVEEFVVQTGITGSHGAFVDDDGCVEGHCIVKFARQLNPHIQGLIAVRRWGGCAACRDLTATPPTLVNFASANPRTPLNSN
jgi:hypothetical protein